MQAMQDTLNDLTRDSIRQATTNGQPLGHMIDWETYRDLDATLDRVVGGEQ